MRIKLSALHRVPSHDQLVAPSISSPRSRAALVSSHRNLVPPSSTHELTPPSSPHDLTPPSSSRDLIAGSSKPNKAAGYTLFEILLVITVISVLASLALMTYRINAESVRNKKVSAELQHVLESGLAYYVDKRAWPTDATHGSHATAPDCSSLSIDPKNDFISYLPNQTNVSSTGSRFCWNQDAQSDHLFWVALLSPKPGPALARQMAARLPNAVITTDPNDDAASALNTCPKNTPCYVRSEVGIPGMASAPPPSPYTVAAIGYCNPDGDDPTGDCHHNGGSDYTLSFGCPGGQHGKAFVIPNFWSGGTSPGGGHFTPANIAGPTNVDCDGSCDINIQAQICDMTSSNTCDDMTQYGGKVGATYIAICKS